jgi:2-dehydropantoate 2-reductase
MLRICVAGAGAVGGTLAVLLAHAGHDVSVLARRTTLAAIRQQGLRLTDLSGSYEIHPPASDIAEFGVQDVVFCSAKTHALADLLPALEPLLGPNTMVVPTINGVPWWYFQGAGGRFDGDRVRAVDPDGALLAAIPVRQIIGCVVYINAETSTPGQILASSPHRLILGELHGGVSDRVRTLSAALDGAGIDTAATDTIRDAVWTKIVANIASNPLSVVSGATLGELFGGPELRDIVMATIQEAMLVGAAYGARFALDPQGLIEMGAKRGTFRTSMLQDFERGRTLELAAICDAVLELAARHDIAMPMTSAITALVRFRASHNSGVSRP